MLGVHDPEPLDVGQSELGDPLLRLAQHRLGDVDAAEAVGARIVRQRYAGADPDLEDAAADAFGGGDRGLPAAFEHRAEHQIIDRRPARIGLGNRLLVELGADKSVMILLLSCARWRRRSWRLSAPVHALSPSRCSARDGRLPATFWTCPMN